MPANRCKLVDEKILTIEKTVTLCTYYVVRACFSTVLQECFELARPLVSNKNEVTTTGSDATVGKQYVQNSDRMHVSVKIKTEKRKRVTERFVLFNFCYCIINRDRNYFRPPFSKAAHAVLIPSLTRSAV